MVVYTPLTAWSVTLFWKSAAAACPFTGDTPGPCVYMTTVAVACGSCCSSRRLRVVVPNCVGVIVPHSHVMPSLDRAVMSEASSGPKLVVSVESAFSIWKVALPPPGVASVAVQP